MKFIKRSTDMVYLLAGEGSLEKDKKVEEITNKIFTSDEARKFDFEILHSSKLSSENLKKSLIALPAIAPQRVMVLRNILKLNPHNKDLILEFVGKKQDYLILILDCLEFDARNAFIKKLTPHVQLSRFGQRKKKNVFDMTNEMARGNAGQALKVLHELLEDGNHPLQLMGGLIWFWGKENPRFSRETFKRGLEDLQNADLNIKRSRLKPEEAIEVVVVKLSNACS